MLQKDIFILQQRDDILYGLYAKLSQDRLAKALPTSYRHGGGDYLVCIFCDSMDFVGQLTEEILHKDITTIITPRSVVYIDFCTIAVSTILTHVMSAYPQNAHTTTCFHLNRAYIGLPAQDIKARKTLSTAAI